MKKCEPEPQAYAFPDVLALVEGEAAGLRASSICSAPVFYTSGRRNDKTVSRQTVTAAINTQGKSEFCPGKTISSVHEGAGPWAGRCGCGVSGSAYIASLPGPLQPATRGHEQHRLPAGFPSSSMEHICQEQGLRLLCSLSLWKPAPKSRTASLLIILQSDR